MGATEIKRSKAEKPEVHPGVTSVETPIADIQKIGSGCTLAPARDIR